MAENLEYQARFKADTADLEKMNRQLDASGERMQKLSDAGTGLIVGLTGMKDAMNGSVSGLLAMAYGAGTAWKALATLSPVLKGIAIALAAAQAAQILFSHFTDKSKKSAEEQAQAVKELGLELSELDKHNNAVDAMAESFDRVERAASAAAEAIKRVNDAQRTLNQAMADAEMADLNLQEATALSAAGLTNDDRERIQREFIDKRADAAKRAAITDFGDQKSTLDQERSNITRDAESDRAKQAQLESAASSATAILQKQIDKIYEAGLRDQNLETPAAVYAASDRMKKELSSDPRAFINKYGGSLDEDESSKVKDAFNNYETRQKELSDFIAGAPVREQDRQSRMDANQATNAAIDQSLASALKNIEASRLTALNALDAGSGGPAADPMQGARDAVAAYRYDKMTDEEKLGDLDRRMRDTREEIKFASDDPAARSQLVVDLVNLQRERDDVSDRIQTEAKRNAEEEQRRQDQIGQHQSAIENLRNYRSTQALDTQGYFEHMYNIQAGKNPDEQVADNTEKMATHLEQITKILEGAQA